MVPASLGGDYFRTRVDIGQDGACRIDTGAVRSGEVLLLSPELTVRAPFLSFLIGGGGPTARVELRLGGSHLGAARVETGSGPLAMRRVVWDVHELVGKVVRFAVMDAGDGDGLVVDDFRETTTAPPPRPAPVWGFADMHAHPVAQLGMGQHVIVGAPDGDLSKALASCATEHGAQGAGGKAGLLMGLLESSYDGTHGHHPTGYPSFDGWPRWSTQAHQQMYVDFIRRAWEGGLRLLVAHAVNDEQLAHAFHGSGKTDDTSVWHAEVDATIELVARHPDFMEIARAPEEARRIIGAGKLAVVLGAEMDALGNCRRDSDCTQDQVRAAIQDLFDRGVRHAFPIHLADNAFGGSAVFADGVFNLLTWYLRGTYQRVAHDDSVAFAFTPFKQSLPVVLWGLTLQPDLYGNRPFTPPFHEYAEVPAGHVNRTGLTELGKLAVSEMMRLGIIVDVDHMGERARTDTLALARERHAPVAMGHSAYLDLGYSPGETDDSLKLRSEWLKSGDDIAAVRALGGALAVRTTQGDVRRAEGSGVETECAGSSASFLQAYAYAALRAGDDGVALGTDFNGFGKQPSPRFGTFACIGRMASDGGSDGKRRAPGKTLAETMRADAFAQDHGVTYAEPLRDAHTHRFFGLTREAPFSHEERAVFIALAAFEGHVKPPGDQLPPWERDVALRVAEGFADAAPKAGNTWRTAAFLVKSGAPRPSTPEDLAADYVIVRNVWDIWHRMESGNRESPLSRHVIGERDFDLNIDGLAHYGLIPDFLQDVSNQLRAGKGAVRDLSLLFRSAETYIRMWERANEARTAR